MLNGRSGGSMKTHDGKIRRQGIAENKMAMKGREEADFARTKPPKPARDYQISQIIEVPRTSTGLVKFANQRIQERKN